MYVYEHSNKEDDLKSYNTETKQNVDIFLNEFKFFPFPFIFLFKRIKNNQYINLLIFKKDGIYS